MSKKYIKHINQKGVALVELAIVLPMLLLLFYAFFAAIRLFATYNALGNIARIGALWASARIDPRQTCTSFSQNDIDKDKTSGYVYDPTTTIPNCSKLAIQKMTEVAVKYEKKLQLCTIDYYINVATDKSIHGCYITVTVSTNYKDTFFGSSCDKNTQQKNMNFGMGATFSPFNPTLTFKANAYRGWSC